METDDEDWKRMIGKTQKRGSIEDDYRKICQDYERAAHRLSRNKTNAPPQEEATFSEASERQA